MHLISFVKDKNIILIDSSYYVFHRYFATYRWFTFQKIDVAIDDIINNQVFMDAFFKHVHNDMKKLCKKWNTTTANILFCMDCMRCDIWRNDVFDQYKAGRTHSQNFNRKIFPIFYDYIEKLKIQSLSYERLEGDDIIYLTQNMLKKKLHSANTNIVIITNDNDFLQLVDKNVLIFNMQFKELKTRGTSDPQTDLLLKAIYGDRSDNIPKIGTGITKEKALAIAQMPEEERMEYIKQNGMYDKFLFNMKLISFDNIPKEYVTKFNKSTKLSFV